MLSSDRPRALLLLEVTAVVEFVYLVGYSYRWPDREFGFWPETLLAFGIMLLFFRVTRSRATLAWMLLVVLGALACIMDVVTIAKDGIVADAHGAADLVPTVLVGFSLLLLLQRSVIDWIWKKKPSPDQVIKEFV
jgi:hypothetical protein